MAINLFPYFFRLFIKVIFVALFYSLFYIQFCDFSYTTKNHKNDENSIILVIQNIFDEKVYYQEIKRAFSSKVLDLYSETEFINNNTQLKISYPINSSDEIITEVIDLK